MTQAQKYDLTYLSLGAGVQSTALLVMSALGLKGVPKAEVAIFADTQAEVRDTYDHLERMKKWVKPHGIPVEMCTVGSLEKQLLGTENVRPNSWAASIPAFTYGSDGREAMLRRQCTQEFKIAPIRKRVREILGLKPRQRAAGKVKARCMIGISLDEIGRVKPSRDPWCDHIHPLIDARMSRHDCENLLKDHGIAVPIKSACGFCPYHDNHFWEWLKTERPVDWKRAVRVDEEIRDSTKAGVKRPAFLHRSLEPLSEVQFDDPNQLDLFDGFQNECEGMCGV